MNDFKNAIKEQLIINPNLVHADKFNKNSFNLKNTSFNSIPKITANEVSNNIAQKNLSSSEVKITSSDPYTTMTS